MNYESLEDYDIDDQIKEFVDCDIEYDINLSDISSSTNSEYENSSNRTYWERLMSFISLPSLPSCMCQNDT